MLQQQIPQTITTQGFTTTQYIQSPITTTQYGNILPTTTNTQVENAFPTTGFGQTPITTTTDFTNYLPDVTTTQYTQSPTTINTQFNNALTTQYESSLPATTTITPSPITQMKGYEFIPTPIVQTTNPNLIPLPTLTQQQLADSHFVRNVPIYESDPRRISYYNGIRVNPTGVTTLNNVNPGLTTDRKSTRLNSSHIATSRMPSSA